MANKWHINQRIKDLADHFAEINEWDLVEHIEAVIKEAEAVDATRSAGIPNRLQTIAGLVRIIRKRLDDLDSETTTTGEAA